jgi:molybdopterin-guanine dinucleotide biosynthesis protein A
MGGVANENLTGLVLAGGVSRRMGADKALIDVHGHPLIVHVATRLAAVCASVLVAPGARPLPDLPWTQVDDRVPGEGPLAGILGGLVAAPTELVAVVGVDMPGFRPDVLVTLAQHWDGEPAVVPVIGGRLQPLHAVYAVAALPRLAALFDAGERSPTRALERVGAAWREMAEPAPWATSLNTADDLARFLGR